MLVPQVALRSTQPGRCVYVANHNNAQQWLVLTGATYGDFVAVTKAVTGHQSVIVGDQQKIVRGAPVILMAEQPTADAEPG
jgi:hypothetical protein